MKNIYLVYFLYIKVNSAKNVYSHRISKTEKDIKTYEGEKLIFEIVNENVIVLRIKCVSKEEYSCNFSDCYEKLKKISLKSNIYNVVINLKNISYINSIAISYIYRLFSFLKKRNGELRISNVESEHLKSIFSVIEIKKVIGVFEKEEDAIIF